MYSNPPEFQECVCYKQDDRQAKQNFVADYFCTLSYLKCRLYSSKRCVVNVIMPCMPLIILFVLTQVFHICKLPFGTVFNTFSS
jgi:hypothetical protein